MIAENYNKIIESLNIRFVKCENILVTQPLEIIDFEESENILIFLKKGSLSFGNQSLEEGQALMIPANRSINMSFGSGDGASMSLEEFRFKRNEFFKVDAGTGPIQSCCEITIISFETRIFDTVSFFHALEIPPFSINHALLNSLIYDITREQMDQRDGYQRVISLKIDHVVIEVLRYILDNNLFVEKIVTNSTYFKDPRLIEIFKYIKDNLSGELTNKILAEIAGVSEDYVGQYFKTLTGINPQDYIEYQRMENAVDLLRTTKMSIRDVGKACGYKDTAYFCRRFKMMYGIPAGKMRKRETLINI